MAALYGRLQGRGKEKTATATDEITARLETWKSAVTLTLYRDGSYVVEVGEKYGTPEFSYEGNSDEGVRA